MFDGLRLLVQRALGHTASAFCGRCRSTRKIVRSRQERISTSKGTSTRLIGRCVVCNGQTSSFVKAA